MYRFFVEEEQVKNTPVYISGDDYNHIRNVLRLKKGEQVLLCTGGDKEYVCAITDYHTEEKQVELAIEDVFANARELPAKITLFQGYPKGDKMESIVQKAVELGVYEIVPVMMKRCVVKLDARKAEKKVERLNAIALSAAKQSKRGRIPEVKEVMTFSDAVKYAKQLDCVLVPYENAQGMDYARELVKSAVGQTHIGIFIGPEGGFEENEITELEQIGGKTLSLGHRILRTETAGITLLSILMFLLDKDEGKEEAKD